MRLCEAISFKKSYLEEITLSVHSRLIQREIKISSQNINRGERSIKVFPKVPRETKVIKLLLCIWKKQPLEVQQKHQLCTRISEIKVPKSMGKSPKLGEYDGKGDPYKQVQLVNDRINYFSIDEASKCKLFALTLVHPTMLWFIGPSDEEHWMVDWFIWMVFYALYYVEEIVGDRLYLERFHTKTKLLRWKEQTKVWSVGSSRINFYVITPLDWILER